MAYAVSQRSLDRLDGVHPDLVAVFKLALSRSPIDFTVLEGLRTTARQRELVAKGASQTMNSRHITGHAVDVAPYANGAVSWDWPLYHQLEPVIKKAAADLGVKIEWGGDWASFPDGPHWQLPWSIYGKDDMTPRAKPLTAPTAPPVASDDKAAEARLIALVDAMRLLIDQHDPRV